MLLAIRIRISSTVAGNSLTLREIMQKLRRKSWNDGIEEYWARSLISIILKTTVYSAPCCSGLRKPE